MVRTAGSIFSPDTSGPLKRRVRKKYATDYADLIVTGALDPDVTGSYKEHGTYGGQPTYKKKDELWFIWYDDSGAPADHWWNISPRVGFLVPPYWEKYSLILPPPTGIYNPIDSAVGTATVSLP